MGHAAGADPYLVHLSAEQIARIVPAWGPPLLGDAAHSVIFDNTKIRQHAPGWNATISWADGAREIISWFDADPAAAWSARRRKQASKRSPPGPPAAQRT